VVLGTASGGAARHAGLLAEGCRRAGTAVIALGPAATEPAFAAGAAAWPRDTGPASATAIPFHLVEISERPRPSRDARALLRLRRLLRRGHPDVVHAHGVRAGAFAALALLGPGWRRARRPGLATQPGQAMRAGRSVRARRPGLTTEPGQAARTSRPGLTTEPGQAVRTSRPGLATQPEQAARAGRPGLVVTVHNAPPAGRGARMVFGGLEWLCARRADPVLCASADLADRMRRRGAASVAEFDVPAAPAPVPSAEAVARAREDLGGAGRPVVLGVGRLAEQKGFGSLLAAAARWRDRDPAPRLAIAGTGPLAAELADTAARTGVDLVLLGDRADIPALLAAADVVAVPSRWEARSLVVQEALAAGTPIVAARVGGIPALTGEDAAVLVPPGDPERLAAGILAVLDDPALAGRLAGAAKARATALPGPAEAVTAALAVYQRVRDARPPR
jgi:glycosyltransferase involved in cell wall biosynthesis